MTPEMETAVKWQSHLPALLACIAVTQGPVLELGVGFFSTPHLHALCGALERELISVEEDSEWRKPFLHHATPMHVFSSVYDNWLNLVELGAAHFGVGFIDHSPGGANRAKAFKALIEMCDFVVMHDAQKEDENFKAVEPMLEGLNWHLCTGVFPHTLIASKTREIPQVLKGM